ncbi:2-oxoacid:acceptor oxidoreductase subunit alpha [bacterium]|nr:2-oxoacid:acceptor oxidoreductase subunit alpha [bacterium]
MDNFSVLIGGKAGDGIDKAGLIIARILNQLGYRLYIYRDYPSIIRGGHTFSIIRASKNKITTHLNNVDFLLALNQDSVDFHKDRLKDNTSIVYNSDIVKFEGLSAGNQSLGLPLGKIIKEENALPVMYNSCIIGGFCKAIGLEWNILERVFKKNIPKEIDLNLRVALRGYNEAREFVKVETLLNKRLPVLTGNEAIALGLIKGGLKAYIAYPMTPSSSILHFLAESADDFSLKVIHPESEIAVILMALGFSYAGERVAVGTSGGGFCLMTEGLSLAGMAELPIVIVVGQRPGPSTGVPTHTAQSDLHFVLNAGQGEFPRFLVSPGDAEEAYFWSCVALNTSWKYQIPSIILADKSLCEGVYSFDIDSIGEMEEEKPILWDKKESYKRYLDTETGVSPLSFVPDKEAIIKVNSYAHDEFGITTEEAQEIKSMQDKRLRKSQYLMKELEKYDPVKIYGNKNSSVALICWGSNKGVCVEAAENLGLKVIHPVVLSPFPIKEFQDSLSGVQNLICVENNSTAQLASLINRYGFRVNEKILKYDGRPFSLDELEERLKDLVK